jgi:hypothetical protein
MPYPTTDTPWSRSANLRGRHGRRGRRQMLRARKAAEGWGANGTHVFLQAGSSYTPLHMQNKRAHRNQINTKIFDTPND